MCLRVKSDRIVRDPQDGEVGYVVSLGTTKAVVSPRRLGWPRHRGEARRFPTTIDLARVVRLELIGPPVAFRRKHSLPIRGIVAADLKDGQTICVCGKEVPFADLPDRVHVLLRTES